MNNRHFSLSRHLFPRLNTIDFLRDGAYRDDILKFIEQGVGGFVLFEGSVDDCAETVRQLRAEASQPLLLAADCEFGLTMRFRGGIAYPSMMGLGEGDDLMMTEEVARAIAVEMGAIGLDWNFAPVLDVNSNPANPIINIRAFGESPDLVAEHGAAYIRGMQLGGIIACGKHFPGHGDTTVDSHIGLPQLDRNREELDRLELIPFRRAIDEGVLSIMSGHLALPSLDSAEFPASLSLPILKFLREDLHFNGVIVTDALDMGAIVQRYGAEEGVVQAFVAGNDVLEIPQDPWKGMQALSNAVDDGRITLERLEESGRRLDTLVEWSIAQRRERELAGVTAFDPVSYGDLAVKAMRQALRVSGERERVPSGKLPVLVLSDGDDEEIHSIEQLLIRLGYPLLGHVTREVNSLVAGSSNLPEYLLLITSVKPRGGAGSVGLEGEQRESIVSLNSAQTILLNLGNPYLLADKAFAFRVDTFSTSEQSLMEGLLRIDRL